MNASLYFALVDAVASAGSPAALGVAAERISATPMHPLERRVLNRALRARTEALALRCHFTGSESSDSSNQSKSLVATG
jgi:hypothetical protein